MKPAPFEYARAGSIKEASELLARDDITARILAGGQSLGPMLNLRLAQPDLLVDITGIPDLVAAERDGDSLYLGACVSHANVEDGRIPDVTNGALAEVARGIAYRAVRNRGTIGGSLAHCDPAADWPCVLPALGARAVVQGADGKREVAVEELMQAPFEPGLEPGEILAGLRIPALSPDARWGYYKYCRKTGEFAEAIAAVAWDPARGFARIVIGALDTLPIVLGDDERLFGDTPQRRPIDTYRPEEADRMLTDAGVRDPLKRQVHMVALRRALEFASA
jgi:carbon-monoxide dehydrogenase medium subunit